jgi:hypothetical protein
VFTKRRNPDLCGTLLRIAMKYCSAFYPFGGTRSNIGASFAMSTLNGCATRGAPAFALFGAFFPAWMLRAGRGIIAAIATQAMFVFPGLANVRGSNMPRRRLHHRFDVGE